MKVVSIIGARPQFIKAAMISRAIESHNLLNKKRKINHIVVHTGQHYDYAMSQAFFDQLTLPAPHYHLGVGSGLHGWMTGTMLTRIEAVLMEARPDWVLVYGDTNTTLAGALTAVKLQIPIAHVESGLRSYNRRMPEEINRVLTDRISDLLFCPTRNSVENLRKEGIELGVYNTGDVMLDAFLAYSQLALRKSRILFRYRLLPGCYSLATVHRQENTDDRTKLIHILEAFSQIAKKENPLMVPLHPRTLKAIKKERLDLSANSYLRLISPLNYLDMLALLSQAKVILTDSGGLQKEAFFAGVPCVTLRNETEWVETVQAGWNRLSGTEPKMIVRAFHQARRPDSWKRGRFFGDGKASERIIDLLVENSPFQLANTRKSLSAIFRSMKKDPQGRSKD
ncbi:MAG: UDP-N-acetylglucosamine 2-epimerase (non-hydrolyzing) [Clostridiales bacterium]|nr:UDP-N-acetylglucosamine 2-epimerase (non-hydrolyzing) [Clostridiales bacterium]